MRRANQTYDLVLVGTGFSSSFFLHRFLERSPAEARVLVLERGSREPHDWYLSGGHGRTRAESESSFFNRTPIKPWHFMLAFGGSSNCWVGNTPRMLPEDFAIHSRYGVGVDWPVDYDNLERYYCDAEDIMGIAGPSDDSPFPRSRPYPQEPHTFSDVDRLFKSVHPNGIFAVPAARPTRSTDRRPTCCANSVCSLCPIDSKFTIANELDHVYADPRVTLRLGAVVRDLEVTGGTLVSGVNFAVNGGFERASGDLVALGANALFNPYILLRSGFEHPELGTGLVEQVSKMVTVHLGNVQNFQGSTYITGHGYTAYGGEHRRQRAAALMELNNSPDLRNERGKWRQTVRMRVIYSDLRSPRSRVELSVRPGQPEVVYDGPSEYTRRGIAALPATMDDMLRGIDVEDVTISPRLNPTESHILGTTPMGLDPATSIVDGDLVHHTVRNLVVLGGSTFPTAAPANPTLTISALALRSADRLTGGGTVPA